MTNNDDFDVQDASNCKGPKKPTSLTINTKAPEHLQDIPSATFTSVVPAIFGNFKYELENLGQITCFSFAYNCGFLTAGLAATFSAILFKKDPRIIKYAIYGFFIGNICSWNICRMQNKIAIETGIRTMNSIRDQSNEDRPRLGIPPGTPAELRTN